MKAKGFARAAIAGMVMAFGLGFAGAVGAPGCVRGYVCGDGICESGAGESCVEDCGWYCSSGDFYCPGNTDGCCPNINCGCCATSQLFCDGNDCCSN